MTSGPEAVLADLLADLANAGLELDPATQARLAALEGRSLQISTRLAPLGERDLTLRVSGGRLRLHPHAVDAPHVIVRGDPSTLLAWLTGADEPGGLRIDGDSTVLGEFTAVLRTFRPDLGGPLARLLGPHAARDALGTAELALAGLRSAFQGARNSVRDGAGRTFLDRAGLDRLLDELDDLRLRADRLGARVTAEEQRRNAP